MSKRIVWAALLLALAVGAGAADEVDFDRVSATDTSTTTTFPEARSSVEIYNRGPDEIYFRLFTSEGTAAAATTSHRMLPSGADISFTHNPRTESGLGYLYVTIVCDTGETATVEVTSK